MLQSLHVENMAVIRKIDIDFSKGFSVLTGETGAGKSVIVDSLKFLLGAKAEREMIRHGESTAEVSALFCELAPNVEESLNKMDVYPDEEGCLTMMRLLRDDGKSVSRINGKTVSLAVLRDAMQFLLHIHGQDDTSFFRQEGTELSVLDAAAHNRDLLLCYKDAYQLLLDCKRQMDKLHMDEHEKRRTMENLRYQIDEIEEISPKIGEEEKLFEEKLKLKNIAKIAKQTGFAYRALRGAEKGNACYIIDRSLAALQTLDGVLPEVTELCSKLEEHLTGIEEIADEIRALTDFDGDDPEEALDRIETRLSKLSSLMRKYGGSEEAVLAYLEDARTQLSALERMNADLNKCAKEYELLYEKTALAAKALSQTRKDASERLVAEIDEMLHALDMPQASFRVDFKTREVDGIYSFKNDGFEDVAFMVAVNPGEPYVPVASCASGGELSRIMLAIKSVIAKHDGMPTVVFDEVDTGVSGKTSRKIGYTIRKNAADTQILCITHSAQIASLADSHLFVWKCEKNGRTESNIRPLSSEERVDELARILGGIHVTEAQRQAARDMLSVKE